MKSFAEIVENVEKEKKVVQYKLVENKLGYGGDDEKTRAISEDLIKVLAKFIGSFKQTIYSLEPTVKAYAEGYWGMDGLEGINNWNEFFALIENHPEKTELSEHLNDQEFDIYMNEEIIMGTLDILKKVHELDPNILDKKVPFNKKRSKKPEPFFKQLSAKDLRKMGLGDLVSGQIKTNFFMGS